MIFCLKCGSKKVHRYVSVDFVESRCKECGFRFEVDLDRWDSDKYQTKAMKEEREVPPWCLLVMSWEREE